MDTPSAVFPSVYPLGVPRALPEAILRPVVLRNFAKPPKPPNWGKMNVYEQILWRRANRTRDKGNRAIYEEQARRAGENRAAAVKEVLGSSPHVAVSIDRKGQGAWRQLLRMCAALIERPAG